jgi:hypothetical protein
MEILLLTDSLSGQPSQYKITVRSQCWNAAIPLAEEALTRLHDDTNNPTANNWTLGTSSGMTAYSKQRTNEDGSYFDADVYYAGMWRIATRKVFG